MYLFNLLIYLNPAPNCKLTEHLNRAGGTLEFRGFPVENLWFRNSNEFRWKNLVAATGLVKFCRLGIKNFPVLFLCGTFFLEEKKRIFKEKLLGLSRHCYRCRRGWVRFPGWSNRTQSIQEKKVHQPIGIGFVD